MKEKLKNMNERSFPNVQQLSFEEIKYFTGGASLHASDGTISTTTAKVTTKPSVAMI